MSTPSVPTRRAGLRRRVILPVLIVSLGLSGAVAGCSTMPAADGSAPAATATMPAADGSAPATPSASAPAVSVPIGAMTMPTQAEVSATWEARPDYVRTLPAEWQEAYAYALARPDVLQWLPCYCGCAGMEHRSNLDCFFQRREVRGSFAYEEHASYCDICVKTANMASAMLREGSTMVQVRAAVDATFGGGSAPGTDTPLPPS